MYNKSERELPFLFHSSLPISCSPSTFLLPFLIPAAAFLLRAANLKVKLSFLFHAPLPLSCSPSSFLLQLVLRAANLK
jgi:hypothetical protein